MTKILFLCHGNICRSPMAEYILKHLVHEAGRDEEFVIESAAVSTEEIGHSIYPPAQRTLRQHGISFDDHRARQVRATDYDRFDLLICMDAMNIRWLKRIVGDDREQKIRLMMDLVGEHRDVADPWYTGDFEATWADCLAGCQALLRSI